jgi:hypothetical protein
MLKSSVAIASSLAVLTTVVGFQPANAVQFKKLIETGQSIPGDRKPLEFISPVELGRDGQVAVLLSTTFVPGAISEQYRGLYSISKGGVLKLVEGGISRGDGTGKDIGAVSLSSGKIAYVVRDYVAPSSKSVLRLGTPGDVKDVISLDDVGPTTSRSLVYTNGIIHLLEGRDLGGFVLSKVRQVDTLTPQPTVTVIAESAFPTQYQEIKAGANSIVLRQSKPIAPSTLSERPLTQGVFKPIQPLGKSPGSCGLAVSFENIVSCSFNDVSGPKGYTLSVRFGASGTFKPIEIPNADQVQFVSAPSISQEKVIFQVTEKSDISRTPTTKIYLSFNAQKPQLLLKSGTQLDGKTISRVNLASNGRSIAVNSAIITVDFQNGSQALYRADF